MELYTSLTRLKMAMGGGAVPAMTALPRSVTTYIDPALTPGFGALNEDVVKGLQCPVRSCGRWQHNLTSHWNYQHQALGGAKALRAALSLPKAVPLISSVLREKWASHRDAKLYPLARKRLARAGHTEASKLKARLSRAECAASMNARNLKNRCDEQIGRRIMALAQQVGRSPTMDDVRRNEGQAFLSAVLRVYGTWNACKAAAGLGQNGRKWSEPEVLESLEAFYDVHGRMPSCFEAHYGTCLPAVPNDGTILRAMKEESWPAALNRAAMKIGVVNLVPSAAG